MSASLLRMLKVLAALYVLATVVMYFAANALIFHPHPPAYRLADGYLALATARGDTVAARWLPNPGSRYTVLFSHGNAEDLSDDDAFLRRLHDAGFAVLAYDYPGYGASTGTPTEPGAYAAADAAYDHATRVLHVPPDRILLHGRSLGGAVAVDLASRRPAAGLVLESAFSSASRVAFGFRPFVFERFNSIAKIARVRVPVLVIHGGADRVIPAEHGHRMFARFAGPKRSLWVPGAGHNDVAAVAGASYWNALGAFAASLDGPGTGG
ncbi:MAG: hypothetical protein JWM27_839 [Gemmatimonadetes bacterium]|nr:hypothetical protein [Gemmatimonadota bacterium]